jgi:hypothetical protein
VLFFSPHRDLFFFQLPYLPELMFRTYDMVRLKHLFRGATPKSLSLVTDEDLEAYKYNFAKSGKQFHPYEYNEPQGTYCHVIDHRQGLDW